VLRSSQFVLCSCVGVLAIVAVSSADAACVNPQMITAEAEQKLPMPASKPGKYVQDVVKSLLPATTTIEELGHVEANDITDALKASAAKPNGDWQALDPKVPPTGVVEESQKAQFSKVCFRRAQFWANDGEIVVATFTSGTTPLVGLVVPTTDDATETTEDPWKDYFATRIAISDPVVLMSASKSMKINGAAFSKLKPGDVVFYRYRK
jgi:hypothetical protein